MSFRWPSRQGHWSLQKNMVDGAAEAWEFLNTKLRWNFQIIHGVCLPTFTPSVHDKSNRNWLGLGFFMVRNPADVMTRFDAAEAFPLFLANANAWDILRFCGVVFVPFLSTSKMWLWQPENSGKSPLSWFWTLIFPTCFDGNFRGQSPIKCIFQQKLVYGLRLLSFQGKEAG